MELTLGGSGIISRDHAQYVDAGYSVLGGVFCGEVSVARGIKKFLPQLMKPALKNADFFLNKAASKIEDR